jgi:hypothetical protein
MPAYYTPETPMVNLKERIEMVFTSELPDSLKKIALRNMFSHVEKLYSGPQLNNATIEFWKILELVQKNFKPILLNKSGSNSPIINSTPYMDSLLIFKIVIITI